MKTVSNSIITMTELVLPQHTNQLGNLLGGQLMHWIDICAALSSSKHAGRICVTASVDNIDFHHPIKLGDVVTIVASVNRVFNSSMEVGVSVCAENHTKGNKRHTNSAYLTFVGLNSEGKPVKSEPIIPESDSEKKRYEEALIRREHRLSMRNK
ncbi:MAG: acyl-CoA thioesterase [Melioribacteraceae bacterium]|nr:acyl-CoA thioesterase [Melioribacteraceae bacterium]